MARWMFTGMKTCRKGMAARPMSKSVPQSDSPDPLASTNSQHLMSSLVVSLPFSHTAQPQQTDENDTYNQYMPTIVTFVQWS